MRSLKKQLLIGVATFVIGAAALINVSADTNHVNVVLSEWAMTPDKTTVSAGPVTFKAINSGPSDIHEIAVVKTDLAPAGLPVDTNGNVDENAKSIKIIGEIEDIAVGASAQATFDLEPGNYVLICNIWDAGEQESHYAEGMYIAFTVQQPDT